MVRSGVQVLAHSSNLALHQLKRCIHPGGQARIWLLLKRVHIQWHVLAKLQMGGHKRHVRRGPKLLGHATHSTMICLARGSSLVVAGAAAAGGGGRGRFRRRGRAVDLHEHAPILLVAAVIQSCTTCGRRRMQAS